MKTLLSLLHRRKMFVELKLSTENNTAISKANKTIILQPTIKKAIKEVTKAAKEFKSKLTTLQEKGIGSDNNYIANDITAYANNTKRHFPNSNHPELTKINRQYKAKTDKLQDLALEVEMNIVGLEISFTQAVKVIDSKLTQVL